MEDSVEMILTPDANLYDQVVQCTLQIQRISSLCNVNYNDIWGLSSYGDEYEHDTNL
jgi:hypothetical protein